MHAIYFHEHFTHLVFYAPFSLHLFIRSHTRRFTNWAEKQCCTWFFFFFTWFDCCIVRVRCVYTVLYSRCTINPCNNNLSAHSLFICFNFMLFVKSNHGRLKLNMNATRALYNISWLVLCVRSVCMSIQISRFFFLNIYLLHTVCVHLQRNIMRWQPHMWWWKLCHIKKNTFKPNRTDLVLHHIHICHSMPHNPMVQPFFIVSHFMFIHIWICAEFGVGFFLFEQRKRTW